MSEETHKEHDGKHLEKLTIKELREIAAEIPHERAILDMKKEELVALIKEARGIKSQTLTSSSPRPRALSSLEIPAPGRPRWG